MMLNEILTGMLKTGTLKTKKIKLPDGRAVTMELKFLKNGLGFVIALTENNPRMLARGLIHMPTKGMYAMTMHQDLIPRILPMVAKHVSEMPATIDTRSKEFYDKFDEIADKTIRAHLIFSDYYEKGNAGKLDAQDKLMDLDLEDYIDLKG